MGSIEPVLQRALFWHTSWVVCDRPKDGAVADCMHETNYRAAYHYAKRKVKLDADKIARQRTAAVFLNNRTRDF